MSGHHAKIVLEGGQAWLEDCNSRNGTAVLRGLAKDKTAAWVEHYEASPLKRQFVVDRAGKQPVKQSQTAERKAHRALLVAAIHVILQVRDVH